MFKNMKFIFSVIVVISLLVGCSNGTATNDTTTNNAATNNNNNNAQTEEVQEDTIQVTLSKDQGEEVISEDEIAIEDGAILMDVMKENYDIEEDGGFINSIDGIAPEEGEEKAWMYSVNDEMAMVGANEFELSAGDEVVFDLQAWE